MPDEGQKKEGTSMMEKAAKKQLILVGNGMAGMRAVEELLKRDADSWQVTVFGAEPEVNYNRIMLSPVLAGEKTFDEIVINDQAWYDDNGVELIAGEKIIAIDRDGKTVTSDKGTTRGYDKLILGTGSDPFIIPVPGKDLPGVITFRDMVDVNAMLEAADSKERAIVIGGGLLGLEAANGLMKNGMDVTVIHLMDTLMERQLDQSAGYLLREELISRGMKIEMEASTTEVIEGEDGRAAGIKLKDGREIPADIVVMAVGIKPNVALAADAGLDVERGVKVNDQMFTSDPNILAVGECVEHRGLTYGLVAPLYEMAKVLADQLAGNLEAAYTGSVTSTKLKVTGIDLFSAGNFQGGDDCEDIVFRDASRGVYKRIVLKDDKIEGAVLYGDTGDGAWYFQMLKDAETVDDMRDTLIFGQAYQGGGQADPKAAVAALSMDAEICGCNGVCKGDIVGAIEGEGLSDLNGVRAHTKASSSCGSCTGLVEDLLAVTLGDEFEAGPKIKPMCPCTDHPHEDVRQLIRAHELKSIPAIQQALQWKTPNGCSSCRPALNYYLVSTWPGEYEDDYQSRFINERAHANIQKDGTYSVVPRMWGGLTNPKELRAIADVADKFDIPTVKVTGGQRIDLLGVKKEDLPHVWADLNAAGMVSGHAYGKALRTVKTCVGSDWCRFGTQDSTGLGVRLEQMTWGSWMPHKVKLAVSGCPRNCAEATIKDFGVVCVDSGYELSVGGNGGIKVRATDKIALVKTEEEVMEYCGAFLQLYREEGHYLERTAPYLERVGVDHIIEKVVDDAEGRAALYERFLHSQSFSQDDPWAERAEGESGSMASWIDVGLVEDIPKLGARVVRLGDTDIAVFRTGDDGVFALEDKCPHKQGPLSQGIVSGKGVACPLHNWVISLETGDVVGPDEGCTLTIPVEIKDGRIHLDATKTIKTTCAYCGVGCGVDVTLDGDGLPLGDVTGAQHPSNYGRLCSKGSALNQTLSLQGRLLHPEVGGQQVNWDTALDHVAAGFQKVIADHGPDAVAFYVSGQCLTEDYYVANKLMKGFIGAANIDTNSRLCMASSVVGHKRAFGSDTVPGVYEDWEEADLVVLVGSNTAWCHPVLYQRLMKAREDRGTKIVVIDPRRTATCDDADLHLPIKPGGDVALFNGLLAALADRGVLDQSYIDQYTGGFEDALAAARDDAQDLPAKTGLSEEELESFFDLFAQTERSMTVYSQGVNQSTAGTDKVNAIINCHLATGRIGKPGMGPFSVTGQPNAMGGREVGGLANQLAAHMDFADPVAVDRVKRFWDAPNMARANGLKAVDLFRAMDEGKVKAVWIMATNPAVSVPDANLVRRALEKCDLVVVSDIQADADTVAYADVKLPSLGWGEKDGTVTNSERRISRQRAFLPEPGEAKADWWQLAEVGKRMGFVDAFDYPNAAAIFREHAALSAFENDGSRDFDLGGLADLSDEDFDAMDPVQWPVREGDDPQATKRFFGDGGFFTPDRKGRFVAVGDQAPAMAISEDFPLVLNTGRIRDQWHTMTRTGKAARLSSHLAEPFLALSSADADKNSIEDDQLVEATTPFGTAILRARVTDDQPAGQVFMPMHWTDTYSAAATVGRLSSPHADPLSGQPEMKFTPVRVTPLDFALTGFLITREAVKPNAPYWTRHQADHALIYELGVYELSLDDIVPLLGEGGQLLEYVDEARGSYRYARIEEGKVTACLFLGPKRTLPSRHWLLQQFAEAELDDAVRFGLLAGRGAGKMEDPGRTVCACFSVGINQITKAIRNDGLTTTEEIGAALNAGTNCGSCLPELRTILAETSASETGKDDLSEAACRSRNLTRDEAFDAMTMVLDGRADPLQIGAFLLLLRYRAENTDEIIGLTEAIRAHIGLDKKITAGGPATLDWPSYAAGRTRGAPWFLLSALLLAQNDVPVLMHGFNSHLSAGTLTEEALTALGLPVASSLPEAKSQLSTNQFSYLPLRNLSDKMQDLIALRPMLGLRTAINTVARLLNPGDAPASFIGIFHPPYLDVQLDGAKGLGFRAGVIKGGGGEAERTPFKSVRLSLNDGATSDWQPLLDKSLGPKVPAMPLDHMLDVWRGKTDDPVGRALVVGTAAQALYVAGKADTIEQAFGEKGADFGLAASDYGAHRAGFPDSFFDRVMAEGWARKGQAVLDLGTGTGTVARGFTARGLTATGLDPAEAMLVEAEKIAAADGLFINWVNADARTTGLADDSFDLVTAGQCFHWFAGADAIREMIRVLKPGGRVIICHFDWLPLKGSAIRATEKLILKHNPDWGGANGLGMHPWWAPMMSEGGLKNLESWSHDMDQIYSHEAWRGRIRASAGITAGGLSDDQIMAFDQELKDLLAKDFPQDPHPMPHRVWAISGVAP
ncbi:nasD [Symbiodinium microadriaticum]|nr:nasD [Symbiodinium microadriaticum]